MPELAPNVPGFQSDSEEEGACRQEEEPSFLSYDPSLTFGSMDLQSKIWIDLHCHLFLVMQLLL